MKLHIDKSLVVHPDWGKLIGQDFNSADQEISAIWPYSRATDAWGYGGRRCVEYVHIPWRVFVMLDEQDRVFDVFVYALGQDEPEKPFR